MNENHEKDIHQINCLTSEMDALYHLASLKLGISDSVSITVYIIYTEGGQCLLKDIYKKSGTTKQTINSAIRSLEKDDIVVLENYNGKSKKVVFTDKGKEFAEKTAKKIFAAEAAAFDSWSPDEINTYIGFFEKHLETFRRRVEMIDKL